LTTRTRTYHPSGVPNSSPGVPTLIRRARGPIVQTGYRDVETDCPGLISGNPVFQDEELEPDNGYLEMVSSIKIAIHTFLRMRKHNQKLQYLTDCKVFLSASHNIPTRYCLEIKTHQTMFILMRRPKHYDG
jgi:hypothetical protein